MSRYFEKVSYNDTGILPTRNDRGSSGYDFYAPKDIIIYPHEATKVITNIKASMEQDEVLMLYVRSSIGVKKNLMLANGTGVVDSSFFNNPDNEGNIMIILYNYSDKMQVIKEGERFAQGVFIKYLVTDDDKPLNEDRTGGIGSSGK